MTNPYRPDATLILQNLTALEGDHRDATDRLFALVYDELRHIAAKLMARERPDHTLQPTALVNEAYLKLIDQTRVSWRDRAHFLRIAARAMRQILVDHARARRREKRGGGMTRVTLDDAMGDVKDPALDVIELDDALSRLSNADDRAARVVELRVFGGMNTDEIAHVLEVSRRTIYSDWDVARAWLTRELAGGG
jgi:RNA polymerase sigma factor (TIGR02999 family)